MQPIPLVLFAFACSLLFAFSVRAADVLPTASIVDTNRMAWWTEARFGMFIHWDMSSIAGTEISWSRKGTKPLDITHDPAGYVEDPVYDHLYEKFNPVNFNARKWVRLAQDAGMKYIVFTAKHHGGFCMWDTQFTDYSIMHTPFHRDVVKELADACHEAGMRFGIYYSPRDWHQPDYGMGDNRKYVDYMNGQLRELLTHYGKVDILWFDSYGRGDLTNFWRIGETFDLVKSLQPDIIINNRLAILGGYNKQPAPYRGDFDTPEQKIGKFQNTRPWESCVSLVTAKGGGWSYRPDGKVKTLSQCIESLVNCAGGDGNLLLDVGPNSLGEIPADQTERLRQIGAWLKVNGPAIYGTHGCWFPSGLKWGSCTEKVTADETTLYLHVFDWPTNGQLVVPDLMNPVTQAYVLKPNWLGRHKDLPVVSLGIGHTNEPNVTLSVPKTAPDPVSTTLVLKIEGTPSIYLFSVRSH